MATYGEALIAIWDGESNGTEYMIEAARDSQGIPEKRIVIHRTDSHTLTEL